MKTRKFKLNLRKVSIANLKLNSIVGGTNPIVVNGTVSLIDTCQNTGPTCDGTPCNNDPGGSREAVCTIGGDATNEGNNLCDTDTDKSVTTC
ncbi:hypothetical protein [Kordia jejudonensis]|uniref:hypothetical protein n=1 Tax=Kordia jejudonensis TaxID=1348245 RepID=UPI0006294A3B|nr:hypothetical protein [Kordia jejudonensis]